MSLQINSNTQTSSSTSGSKNNSVGFALKLTNKSDVTLSLQGVFVNVVLDQNTLTTEGLVTDEGVPDVQRLMDMLTSGKFTVEAVQTGLGNEKKASGFFG